MKRVPTFLLTLLWATFAFAQIDEGNGVFPVDACDQESCTWLIPGDEGADSLWHFGTPDKLLLDSAYSGSICWVTDSTEPYGDGRNDYFTVALPIAFPTDLILGFWHLYDTDTTQDGGIVEVSFDKGNLYENAVTSFVPIARNTENFYSESDSLHDDQIGFSGSSGGWVYSRIQWIWVLPVKDMPDSVYVRFRFTSDSTGNDGIGWVIDDMDIQNVNFPGSIADPEGRVPMTVGPVPTTDRITVQFDAKPGKEYVLSVRDLQGRDVMPAQSSLGDSRFNLVGLPSGTYWVLLEEDQQLVGRQPVMLR